MPMMVEAALRAAVLIGLVWAVLAVIRPDMQVRATVWRAALCSALVLPLLMPFIVMKVDDRAVEQVLVTAGRSIKSAFPRDVFNHYGPGFSIAFYVYIGVVAVLLLRLAAGLFLTWQVARYAPKIDERWTKGVTARICRRISVPVTLGKTVLLPADWTDWSADKRSAVMAHERSHVENHDFYWQILAQIHRAVFWFNPLAWWLLAEMSRIDELVSDEAAIIVMDDRPHYAEVLLTMSNTQDYLPSGIAMAKTAGIKQRIEYVLSAVTPAANLSRSKRAAISAATVPLAFLCAIGLSPAHASKMQRPQSIGDAHICLKYYPKEAYMKGIEGRTTLTFTITTQGSVSDIRLAVPSGSLLLDAAAAECVRDWKYQPATKDGVPVAVPWKAEIKWAVNHPQYDD